MNKIINVGISEAGQVMVMLDDKSVIITDVLLNCLVDDLDTINQTIKIAQVIYNKVQFNPETRQFCLCQ